ncbi:membrane protein insertion efficiency factor YidD [Streptomyces sp. NPDC007929]|uniref:membrane protein insertion efficiency factor YidD n=1 Tax=unclassified Streptomyces TaxID=2593676 RepID=UPI0036ED6313
MTRSDKHRRKKQKDGESEEGCCMVSPTRSACCPYTPTCSTYAVQALHRHGALRGGRLVLSRLLHCRPGAARRRGRLDPVPSSRG